MDDDNLHRFVFDGSGIRGELVHLDRTWQALLQRQDYPSAVRQILGEAAAATALLAATIKFDGILTLQARGDGPLRMLVVECTGQRTLRGLARWRGDLDGLSFPQLVGRGTLVMTIDPGEGSERYQGIVELAGDSLATCLQHYFARSEQLPTRLWLGVDARRAAGLLVQEMPESAGRREDADAWDRVCTLADTVTPRELLGLPARTLMHRLFHEEQVRVFDPQPWRFLCKCSREKVATVLRSLGRAELHAILEEEQEVKVDCEYCSDVYRFDTVDVEQLLSDATSSETPSLTRH
jgi:molecular chaperone Hsp33